MIYLEFVRQKTKRLYDKGRFNFVFFIGFYYWGYKEVSNYITRKS